MSHHLSVAELAAELVRVPSVNPMGRPVGDLRPPWGEACMAEYVAHYLTGLGGQVRIEPVTPGRPNITAFFDFGAAETVLFEAHLDTVPVEGMIIDPFAGILRDGRLLGRGACDVKGPMAAMLTAIAHVVKTVGMVPPDHGSRPAVRYNALFAAVCDEEYGFSGVRHLTERLAAERGAFSPVPIAFAVVAEPTELEPVVAHKGVVRWEATAAGVAAHASLPERGKNAIYTMARALTGLEAYAAALRTRAPHADLGAPSLSVGTIQGGSAVNVVPDFCTIQIDRRLVPGETPEAATAELRELASSLGITLSDPVMAAPAFHSPADGPAAEHCLAAARAAGHAATRTKTANYCTDASFYASCNLPAVVFGPGTIDSAHTAAEEISLSHLSAGVEAYRVLLTG